MYVNLHTLPPGHEMFTLYVGHKDAPVPDLEEYDAVVPIYAGKHFGLVGKVIGGQPVHRRDPVQLARERADPPPGSDPTPTGEMHRPPV